MDGTFTAAAGSVAVVITDASSLSPLGGGDCLFSEEAGTLSADCLFAVSFEGHRDTLFTTMGAVASSAVVRPSGGASTALATFAVIGASHSGGRDWMIVIVVLMLVVVVVLVTVGRVGEPPAGKEHVAAISDAPACRSKGGASSTAANSDAPVCRSKVDPSTTAATLAAS